MTTTTHPSWETGIVSQAIKDHIRAYPKLLKQAIVAEKLLDRLEKERLSRERRGLDHWMLHAPAVVSRLLNEAVAIVSKKAYLTAFYEEVHEEALAFAMRILEHKEEAADAVGETYVKLLAGKTQPKYFFRSLKFVCLNKVKRFSVEGRIFSDHEEWEAKRGEDTESLDYVPSGHPHNIPSTTGENRDPMEILLEREEQQEQDLLVEKAKKDPKWRYVKRRKWAKPLVEMCGFGGLD